MTNPNWPTDELVHDVGSFLELHNWSPTSSDSVRVLRAALEAALQTPPKSTPTVDFERGSQIEEAEDD